MIPIDELVGETEANSYEPKMAALIDAYHESLNIGVQLLARRFRYAGMARKVVGMGSIGLRAWVVLAHRRGEYRDCRVAVSRHSRSADRSCAG